MRHDFARRVRWGNVGLACAVLAALAGIVVWPLLTGPAPSLPPDASRPLVPHDPTPAPEAAAGERVGEGEPGGSGEPGARRPGGEERPDGEAPRRGAERPDGEGRRRGETPPDGTERSDGEERRRGDGRRRGEEWRREARERRRRKARARDREAAARGPARPPIVQPRPAAPAPPRAPDSTGGEFGFERVP